MVQKQTPLMEQYWSIKSQHQDKILFFRMGDFFEMFDKDAEVAAPILNISLTRRNKKADSLKMCGIPHHSIANFIPKLLVAGFNVAICDQIEPAKKKGIVKRAVTRILSPGMVYDPASLDQVNANYMSCFDEKKVAFLDISTGSGFYYDIEGWADVLKLYQILQPVELVLSPKQKQQVGSLKDLESFHITSFDSDDLLKRKDLYSAFKKIKNKHQNSSESIQRLVSYVLFMQGETAFQILDEFEHKSFQREMHISNQVHAHLEVFKNYEGSKEDTLFSTINRTKTAGGARYLRKRLQFPLIDKEELESRWNEIEYWLHLPEQLNAMRNLLSSMGDGERKLGKLTHPQCHGQDILNVGQVFSVGLQLRDLMEDKSYSKEFQLAELWRDKIYKTIRATAPLGLKDGGFINNGVNEELDECFYLSQNSQKELFSLEELEKKKTKISSLKIRYNNIFGYYIEVTKTHIHNVPSRYHRKQTLANVERYTTEELQKLEEKILSSRLRQVELEQKVFEDLRQDLLGDLLNLLRLCHYWNKLDVSSSLAFLAIENKYVRPQFGDQLHLVNSRHPVLEKKSLAEFIPNTLEMKPGETLLLTGPNMAGKSTLMRQVALAVLMAQSGGFVAAEKATFPLFHKIFTRIGASDFLSKGLSTFMVEMKETAEILKKADSKSLVILDEIGRGTATFDGMSLAQAILEFFADEKKPYLLSATHYHELTQLAHHYPSIKNGSMAIKEKEGKIHFLYTLVKTSASQSYGIQVARLAGIPSPVLKRALVLLKEYESFNGEKSEKLFRSLSEDLEKNGENSFKNQDLSVSDIDPSGDSEVLLREILEYSVQEKTPLDAMNQIALWQKKIKDCLKS